MAPRNELRGAIELAADAVALLSGPVQSTHRALAGRVFSRLGTAAAPVQAVHDGVSGLTYTLVRGIALAAGAVGSGVMALTRPGQEVVPIGSRPGGSTVLGVINGVLGNRLAAAGNDLTLDLTVRVAGRDVPTRRSALTEAFPGAHDHLVVFMHGLVETERSWRPAEIGGDGAYADRLAAELPITPVMVRGNTGLHISTNGAALAALLDRLIVEWPVPVRRIDLVGHSMGGLILRSACAHAQVDRMRWVDRVGHIVYLGAPHAGAPLERLAQRAAWSLRGRPETRAWGELLDLRSDGIRDLGFGYLLDEEWQAHRAEELLHDSHVDVPLLHGVRHHAVAGHLMADAAHPVARLLGDLMVTAESAGGDGRLIGQDGSLPDLHVLPRTGHRSLLDHPRVHELLAEWIGDRARSRPGWWRRAMDRLARRRTSVRPPDPQG